MATKKILITFDIECSSEQKREVIDAIQVGIVNEFNNAYTKIKNNIVINKKKNPYILTMDITTVQDQIPQNTDKI